MLIKTPPVFLVFASSKKASRVTSLPLFLFLGFLNKPPSLIGISIVAASVKVHVSITIDQT